jgi:hypothetical protein
MLYVQTLCLAFAALDLSANWLSDLSEGFLDNIALLDGPDLHCNRLQNLPWYNFANNQLRSFLKCYLAWSHPDLSSNDLDELPSETSRLQFLIELKITGNQIPCLPLSLAELRHLELLD